MALDRVVAFEPSYIRRHALMATFTYPKGVDANPILGWANVPVFPELWGYIGRAQDQQRCPSLDELVGYLMARCEAPRPDIKIRRRAEKLVMDFTRDWHAYALLFHSKQFDWVSYSRAQDLDSNIDFLALPKGPKTPVAIQAAMRANWSRDIWTDLKQERVRRRGGDYWNGPLYWMTNRNVPVERLPNGLWLFTMEHVDEVVAAIDKQFAAQQRLPF